MKKTILLFTFALFTSAAIGQSNIKANPFGLMFGFLNACYELPMAEKSSIIISGSYFSGGLGDTDATYFGAGVGYRMYLNDSKEGFRGIYVMPQIGFNTGSEDIGDNGFTGFGGGVDLGYQWIFGGGFVLDLGAGASYTSYSGDNLTVNGGIGPRIITAIGYAF